MRYITRLPIEDTLAQKLDNRTMRLLERGGTSDVARSAWKVAQQERDGVRSVLAMMALGVERCMYCGDSFGTDIDHFEPISRAPLRTFDWLNHLLACKFCNSNCKRAFYPCDHLGDSLLIDPTREDPLDHLKLILQSGRYHHLTPKGETTIHVFGLNRPDLIRGRQNAFVTRGAVLCFAQILLGEQRSDEAILRLAALREEPHSSVLWEMIRVQDAAGAEEVLGSDVLKALKDPRIRKMLGAE